MKLKLQRKIAARILKCGEDRVWIDPTKIKEVEQVITASDVKHLIKQGYIKKLPVRGTSRARARKRKLQRKKGRRRGPGSRKGPKKSKKEIWMERVRALRRYLRRLKEEGRISTRTYRDLYRKVKGGTFKSKAHLKLYLDKNELWVERKEV